MDETEIYCGKQNKPERKETNIAQYHLYVDFEKRKKEIKKSNSWKQSVQWWLPGAWEWRKEGEVDKRVQTSSYKMNDSEALTHSLVAALDNTLLFYS